VTSATRPRRSRSLILNSDCEIILKKLSKASKKKEARKDRRREAQKSRRTAFIVLGVVVAIIVISATVVFIGESHGTVSTTTSETTFSNPSNKSVILYVNQGNALVDRNSFSQLLSFAKLQHFNTIFFQVYRSGEVLFNQSDLSFFVENAHLYSLSIYFALYFTSPTQTLPNSIYGLGEDGINLDMSTLPISFQTNLLAALKQSFTGKTAVTSTNLTSTLTPDLLILETYDFQSDEAFIHPGIIASVEPLGISTDQDYQEQFQYALTNSDGVMVFDYYGMLKTGF
jgi:hypothetical protein